MFKRQQAFILDTENSFVQKAYNKPTHIAQREEPWSHLHSSPTVASSRRSNEHPGVNWPEQVSDHLSAALTAYWS